MLRCLRLCALLLMAPLFLACRDRASSPPVYSLLAHHPEARELSEEHRTSEVSLVKGSGEETPSILARAPSKVRFVRVPIHIGAKLEMATGLVRPEAKGAHGIDFLVSVRDGESAEEVLRHTVLPSAEGPSPNWRSHEIDLSAWEGKRIDLELQMLPRDTTRSDFGAWGSPRIVASKTHSELAVPERVTYHSPMARVDRAGEPIDVPPGGLLTVSGTLWRRGHRPGHKPVPPMRLLIEIEDELVASKTIRFQRGWEVFETTVVLDRWVGKRITPTARIEPLSEAVRVNWRKMLLSIEKHTVRQASDGGRNLLFVVVDTLRSDHMSLYGYPRRTTPRLEDLAKNAMVWDHAISASSWTMPATASFLTGLYPTEHGVQGGQPLLTEVETLADRLQEKGFTTLGVSANPIVGRGEGFGQGHELFLHLPWARAETVTRVLGDLLEEVPGSRWFAYAHFIDPHDPYDAPPDYSRAFGDPAGGADWQDFLDLVRSVNFGEGGSEPTPEQIQTLMDSYDEEILYWDDAFSRFLMELTDQGLLENTVLVVTSDHGEEFLDHGKLKHGDHLFEETVAVPLLIHAPGLVPPAREMTLSVETRRLPDLLVELLDTQDTVTAEELTRSLAPPRNLVFLHTGRAQESPGSVRTDLLALRDGRWKLIEMPAHGWQGLFDLAMDPGETHNRASDRPDVVERYSPILQRWWAHNAIDEPQDEILEKLRALGYIR